MKPWTRRRALASLITLAAYAGASVTVWLGAGMRTRGADLVTWEVLLLLALSALGAIALSAAYRSRPRSLPCPDYARIASLEREIWGETFHHDGVPEPATANACQNGHPAGELYYSQVKGYFCRSCEAARQARAERVPRTSSDDGYDGFMRPEELARDAERDRYPDW